MTETEHRTQPDPTRAKASIWSLTVVCALAWMVPGMGHILLRRYKRGLVFLLVIPLLFFWGLDLGAKIYHYEAQQPLSFFAMIAQFGMGVPYFVARAIANFARVHPGSMFYHFAENFRFGNGYLENVTFEYGNTFAIIAGLLNYLVILDAYDIAVGRKI
jgi:hypothetical protein